MHLFTLYITLIYSFTPYKLARVKYERSIRNQILYNFP